MLSKYFLSVILLVFTLLTSLQLDAASSYYRKKFKSDQQAANYRNEHFSAGCCDFSKESWLAAAKHFEKVVNLFPRSDEAAESYYYLGICYYNMEEYDFANAEFSRYLGTPNHPEYFEDALRYKMAIANHFKTGKKCRIFTMRIFPKWACGKSLALSIYDEIITAVPNHELAAEALMAKGALLESMGEYKLSIEAYQTFIKRFSKHEWAPSCYLNIAKIYYEESKIDFQNPDILALAELNAERYQDHFPRDPNTVEACCYVRRIKELYAKGLCDVGRLYERMKHPKASAIYYRSAILDFPDTQIAEFCRNRLICLGAEEMIPTPQEDANSLELEREAVLEEAEQENRADDDESFEPFDE